MSSAVSRALLAGRHAPDPASRLLHRAEAKLAAANRTDDPDEAAGLREGAAVDVRIAEGYATGALTDRDLGTWSPGETPTAEFVEQIRARVDWLEDGGIHASRLHRLLAQLA